MSPRSNRKPAIGQRSTLIKHVTPMSYKLEPAIWSRDTGQRTAWFDEVSIDHNMMSYIKKVQGKPGQHASINLLFGVWPPSTWAFCLRMREMSGIFLVRRHLLFLKVRRVFKRVIYVVREILSREMKDYNNFRHISNTVDIHSFCRDFGWGYINDQSTKRTG